MSTAAPSAASWLTLSQHLRVLRAGHLVQAERRGREIAYSLTDEHVAHIAHDAVVHATERELHR